MSALFLSVCRMYALKTTLSYVVKKCTVSINQKIKKKIKRFYIYTAQGSFVSSLGLKSVVLEAEYK